ncbi:hypothetical protein V6N13_140331 [Hibiscus sabdariffa]
MVPLGKATLDDLRRRFSKPGPHIFKDATLPISFLGPHVVEHLISTNTQASDLNLFLDKAISGCSGNQLTLLLKSAAVAGKADLVRSLIDHGGDVNHKDSNGRSLVSLASEAGHLDVVNVLISSGCEIDNSIDHVFHYAAAINSVDLMDALFRAYKNTNSIDSVDFHGRSPIHISATHGYIQVVRFCLSVGASPDVLDINKCTPLHLAAKGGHLDTVECLLEASNYTKYALNKQGKTAFALAVENDCSNVYDSLHLGDVLNRAARVGDVNGIKSCIGEGANVNGRDQNGWTPLHRAAFKGHVEVALLLIGHGAKANLKSLKGLGMGSL